MLYDTTSLDDATYYFYLSLIPWNYLFQGIALPQIESVGASSLSL